MASGRYTVRFCTVAAEVLGAQGGSLLRDLGLRKRERPLPVDLKLPGPKSPLSAGARSLPRTSHGMIGPFP